MNGYRRTAQESACHRLWLAAWVTAYHCCSVAAQNSGNVVIWGAPDATPFPSSLTDVTNIFTATSQFFAQGQDGTYAVAGKNLATVPPLWVFDRADVVCGGDSHWMALWLQTGVVMGWGSITVPVSARSNATAIACGPDYGVVLTKDQQVTVFNGFGISTVLPQLSGATAIAAGRSSLMGVVQGQVVVITNTCATSGLCTLPPAAQQGVTSIMAAESYAISVGTNGIAVWGQAPVQAAQLQAQPVSTVVEIAAGGAAAIMLLTNNKLVCAGSSCTQVPMQSAQTVLSVAANSVGVAALLSNNPSPSPTPSPSPINPSPSPPIATPVASPTPSPAPSPSPIPPSPSLPSPSPSPPPSPSPSPSPLLSPAPSPSPLPPVPSPSPYLPSGASGRLVTWGVIANQFTFPTQQVASRVFVTPNHFLAQAPDSTFSAVGITAITLPAMSELYRAMTVCGGDRFLAAIFQGGFVKTWGLAGMPKPLVPASASVGAIDIQCGSDHALVLLSNGTVVAFGGNQFGQLLVPPGLKASAIAAGMGASYAIDANTGAVLAWGANTDGQLLVPAAAKQNVALLAAGKMHVLAMTAMGQVLAWGRNVEGQSTVPSVVQPVGYGSAISSIKAGYSHSVALLKSGQVVVWGQVGYSYVPDDAQYSVVAIQANSYGSVCITTS